MLRSLSALSACALLLVALAGCGGGGGEKAASQTAVLKFTAIPDQNTTLLQERFAPMAAHLSQVLGVPVEYVPARDYQASVEMFRNGDVHLAWFGGLTGVQARAAVPGARAIAQGKADPEFYSYIIANASTGLEKSDDFPMGIRDLTFTFGSESSTSGRLMPEHFIRTLGGAAPAEFFSQPFGFSGSHDKTGRHCPADDPNGKLDIVAASGYWLEGAADRGIKHICWDGCMFPNEMLETPATWNTILDTMLKVRDAHGWD